MLVDDRHLDAAFDAFLVLCPIPHVQGVDPRKALAAAIEAYISAAHPVTPEGMRLVPVEPLKELLLNVSQWDRWQFGGTKDFRDGVSKVKAEVFRVVGALIAAAPPQRQIPEGEPGWRYSINYGPEGEQDWANLITPEGQHVANIRTHHAVRIVAGLNAAAPSLPPPEPGAITQALVADLVGECERAMKQRDEALTDPSKRGVDGRTHDTTFEHILRVHLDPSYSFFRQHPDTSPVKPLDADTVETCAKVVEARKPLYSGYANPQLVCSEIASSIRSLVNPHATKEV